MLTADAILNIYTTMGYTAMAVGPLDLTGGIEYLRESVLKGSPWISANIMTSDNEPFFPPWIIQQTAKGKIGIIGITSYKAQLPEGFTATTWQDALPAHIKKLSGTCDFILLLSNLDDEQNANIAAQYPQLHLIISANKRSGNKPPELFNNTIITQTHTKGKYLGILKIDWSPELKIWENTDQNISTIIVKLEHDLQNQIEDLSRDIEGNKTAITMMTDQKKHLAAFSANSNQQLTSTFSYRFRALSSKITENSEISSLTAQLKKHISKTNKKISKSQVTRYTSSSQPPSHENYIEFAGSKSCSTCHDKQYTAWENSDHARAYSTLELKNQHYNLECLGCHVTHKMESHSIQNDDVYLLGLPKQLLSVTCESCHGPGKSHVDSLGQENTFRTIDESVCRQCHTVKMDNTFNFNTALQHLSCK